MNRRTSERRAELAPAIPSEKKEAKGNRRTSERRAELAPAIPSEEEEGKSQSNEWLEPVSDEEYQRIHQ